MPMTAVDNAGGKLPPYAGVCRATRVLGCVRLAPPPPPPP